MDSLSYDLLFAVGCTAACALLIAVRTLPLWLALALVAVRFALPTIYFAWYFDGYWTMLDDLTYLDIGGQLLDLGYHPLSLLTDSQAYDTTCAMTGGRHILYAWWNLAAQYLFGEHYFAPVLMNVTLTFVAAECAGRLAVRSGAPDSYRTALQAFFILHWDVVSWSSVMNLKDVLVLSLTLAVMHRGVCWLQERRLRDLALLTLLAGAFFWLRFYVPLAMMAAGGIWVVGIWNDARKYLLLPLILAGLYVGSLQVAEYSDHFSSDGLLANLVRFLLTPIPWMISPGWEFVTIPSILHWLLILPALAGGAMLWSESLYARLPLVYFAVASGLYAMTDELLGPRHRLQVVFVIIWTQFHLCWRLRHAAIDVAQLRTPAGDVELRLIAARGTAAAA